MYLSLVASQGVGIYAEEEFNPWIRVTVYYHRANDRKFCPRFYSQDVLGFDSLSRDWILKLHPNSRRERERERERRVRVRERGN